MATKVFSCIVCFQQEIVFSLPDELWPHFLSVRVSVCSIPASSSYYKSTVYLDLLSWRLSFLFFSLSLSLSLSLSHTHTIPFNGLSMSWFMFAKKIITLPNRRLNSAQDEEIICIYLWSVFVRQSINHTWVYRYYSSIYFLRFRLHLWVQVSAKIVHPEPDSSVCACVCVHLLSMKRRPEIYFIEKNIFLSKFLSFVHPKRPPPPPSVYSQTHKRQSPEIHTHTYARTHTKKDHLEKDSFTDWFLHGNDAREESSTTTTSTIAIIKTATRTIIFSSSASSFCGFQF